MPPTRGNSWIQEIDGGFSCYVVLVRDAFEVRIEQRLVHVSCPMRVAPLLPPVGKAG